MSSNSFKVDRCLSSIPLDKSGMKVVYAITSNGQDIYTAMTRVSLASVRISNPGVNITVACDAVSDKAIKFANSPLLKETDNWVVCETPEGDAGFRNRHVKTRLRQIIEGPFLFLDSDTFVRGDLSEIFDLDADIAGSPNHSKDTLEEQIWEQDATMLKVMNWQIGSRVYINGGVMFYNDTQKAYQFAADWHRRWLLSFEQHHNYRDQPALNSALFSTEVQLKVLSHDFNVQIQQALSVNKEPIIWHYYSSDNKEATTAFDILARKILEGMQLDMMIINKMINRQHPWRCDSWLDDWIANRVMRRERIYEWETTWFSGRKIVALMQIFKAFYKLPLLLR